MGPSVGILVKDELTGEILGAVNPYASFTPASTQKLLTGIAVLAELDPEARLATRVLQDGSRLILEGGGDMLLAAGSGNPDQVDDHAGLGDLAALTAAQVKLSGRTAVTLEVDDSLFQDPRIAAAVPASEQRVFVAPVASLAVNQARADDSKSDSAPRVADPAMRAAEIFAQALAEYGITVEGRPGRVMGTTTTIPEIARVESATISEINEWAMQRSDNTITEVLGRLVANQLGIPATAAGAVDSVRAVVSRLGVNLAGAVLVDLSGLGRGSLLTPTQLVDVVDLAVGGPAYLRELATGQPIGGLSGTLATRFTGSEPATGMVRAKTGSLPGVTALSGTVLTANGRLLLFTILADQTPGPGQFGARAAMDAFVNQLAALGSPE
ncbi:MAG: D-alanyl-D-alanine carboxypeptidase/D-alanyl-D-alanine-endopeptidase [Promicromonosporaceae bacterium]|nr:D-alanyl-D-alanine carboxypeptidase/D-alanyl-D-alanine-endopeptidase [Promicromonosporaceae bacterium]